MSSEYGFDTRAIHAGQEPDPTTGAVVVPIYATSTYAQQSVGVHSGYEYSRSGNPTRSALEVALAAVEGGTRGLAFASGLAAEDTLLRAVCRPGDHAVVPHDAYGGTYRLFDRVHEPWGLTYSSAPISDVPRCGPRSGPRPAWSGWRRRPTRCWASRTSPRWRRSPTRPARCSWWTTPSLPPTCRTRWRWAPTWSCTPPPSTSAVTVM